MNADRSSGTTCPRCGWECIHGCADCHKIKEVSIPEQDGSVVGCEQCEGMLRERMRIGATWHENWKSLLNAALARWRESGAEEDWHHTARLLMAGDAKRYTDLLTPRYLDLARRFRWMYRRKEVA